MKKFSFIFTSRESLKRKFMFNGGFLYTSWFLTFPLTKYLIFKLRSFTTSCIIDLDFITSISSITLAELSENIPIFWTEEISERLLDLSSSLSLIVAVAWY
ncbi:MAG: hypothetical protein KDC67_13115 [Ignavibacteriae bacterium]|nr:hypothetical protein [Ignavibacteriota bacterium]